MAKRAHAVAVGTILSWLAVVASPGDMNAQLAQGPAQGTSAAGMLTSTASFPIMAPAAPFEIWRAPKHHIDLLANPPGPVFLFAQPGSNEQNDLSRLITLRGAPGTRAPGLVTDFQGITQTSFIPPDPIMAAGPNQLMGLVNSQFAIFDKTGTNLKQINARTWFTNVAPTNNAFDPKVFYDHFADRWVMVWIGGDFTSFSQILISVSDDSDPQGNWCNFVMPGNTNGAAQDSTGIDYQGVGFDQDAVYVTGNQFHWSDGQFRYVKLRILPKSTLYNATCPAVTWTDFWDLRDPTLTTVNVFTVRPAHTFGTPGVQYLINDSPFVQGDWMALWSLTNPLSPTPTLTAVNVPTTRRFLPPDANQLGGSTTLVDVGGPRVRNAVYRDGSIWTAHSVASASGLYARARYVRIDVTGPTVLEDVSFGSDGCWLYYPAIMADSASNMTMVYNQSCTDEFISARYTGRTTIDVALQPSAELKAGEGNYVRTGGDGRNRWGDYNGAALDPSQGNRVWLFAEYARAPSDIWGTWFGQVIPTTLGDVNLDGVVNVADVILLVEFVLEISSPSGLQAIAADCTPDQVLDIGDLVCVVNVILGPAPAQMLAAAPSTTGVRELARLNEAPADPITGQRTVLLEAEFGPGVAGMQARVKYDASRVRIGAPELTARASGFQLESRDVGDELIVLVYGGAGDALEPGDGPLVRLPVFMPGADDQDPGLELTQMRLADRLGIVRSVSVGSAALTTLPNRFKLGEPYPNPVGASGTRLNLEIPEATSPSLSGAGGNFNAGGTVRVVVEVFNVRGQRIRTVMAEDLVPGRHTISWDGRSDRGELVGSGLYVLRMQAGTVIETRKLIVSNR